MTTPLKRHPSAPSSASSTRLEVERLVEEIRERVLQTPDRAAKILASWIKGSVKKSATPEKKSA